MIPLGDVSTPVYVWDRETFENNIKRMKRAFQNWYPNFNIAYSYKTNYASAICETVSRLNCMAEVVSPMELVHAAKFHSMNNIVYNGVIRDDYTKLLLAHNGGRVNVDNLEELKGIEKEAKKHDVRIKIGVRLNFPVDNGVTSRFGIEAFSHDFREMIKILKRSKNLILVGVHCHISKARELSYWEKRVDNMMYCIEHLEYQKVLNLEYIDFGSNMYAPMEDSLARQFSDEPIPRYEDYARCICEKISSLFLHRKNPPKLIIEAGTPIVSNTISVMSQVVGIKTVDEKTFITMDCSTFNLGAISKVKTLPIEVIPKSEKRVKVIDAVITGYTCIEDDVLLPSFTGYIGIGDIICFSNVGAYSLTFSPNFIMPTIGMIDEKGNVVRKKTEYDAPFREDLTI